MPSDRKILVEIIARKSHAPSIFGILGDTPTYFEANTNDKAITICNDDTRNAKYVMWMEEPHNYRLSKLILHCCDQGLQKYYQVGRLGLQALLLCPFVVTS